MYKFFIVFVLILLSGCNTLAGTVNGIGEDVKSGTDKLVDMIKPTKPAGK